MIEKIIFKRNPDGTIDLILKDLSSCEVDDILAQMDIKEGNKYVWPSNMELIISTKDKRKVFY